MSKGPRGRDQSSWQPANFSHRRKLPSMRYQPQVAEREVFAAWLDRKGVRGLASKHRRWSPPITAELANDSLSGRRSAAGVWHFQFGSSVRSCLGRRPALLERLSRNFRLLLNAFDGAVCPLCAVRFTLERKAIERMRAKARLTKAWCGHHLEAYLAGLGDPADQARQTRQALEASSADGHGCWVCGLLDPAEAKLLHSMRRLDAKLRFRKALEGAPLFCREHERSVIADDKAENFAAVQRAKLLRLRDKLTEAALRGGEQVKPLIDASLAYLGRSSPEPAPHLCYDSAESADAEFRVFEAWDNEQQLKRLGDLEAEAASLRYRNAVLTEENRRLRLAHTALEATQRDLEKDRADLLAARNRIDASSSTR